MKFKTALLSAGVLASSALSASAQVALGGWVGYEYDNYTYCCGTDEDQFIRINGLLSYTTGDYVFGIGTSHEFGKYDNDDWEINDGGFYYLAGYRNVTVTYGEIWGAGNIFPEDYFGMSDPTSNSDQTLRVDFETNGHHFAASYDFNGEENDFELGYRGMLGNFDIVAGYEGDNQVLGIIVGQDKGRWGWQVAMIQDFDNSPSDDQYGVTLFYDVTDAISVAGNYAMEGDGDLEGWGVVATYDIGVGTLKGEFIKHRGDNHEFEIGIVLPFGSAQPSGDARFSLKEYNRGLIY